MKTIACRFGALSLSFLILGLLTACATTPGEISNISEAEPENAQPSAPLTQVLPPQELAPSTELLMTQPDLMPNSSEAPVKPLDVLGGPRISLVAQEADIRTVLLAISKEVRQNIIIDPSIREWVTVDLKEVTLTQALDNLLKPLGLDFEVKGNFVHVFPKRMVTRTFRLNYIISRRHGSSSLQSSSGQGTGGNAVFNQANNSRTSRSSTEVDRTFTNLFTSEETDLWREIFFGLQRMVTGADAESLDPAVLQSEGVVIAEQAKRLGKRESDAEFELKSGSEIVEDTGQKVKALKGYFSINRQAGLIVIKDYPEVLMQVAEFLEEVEGSVQRQVFISAKILEVALNDEFRLGIDWSKVSPFGIVHDNRFDLTQFETPNVTLNRAVGDPIGTVIAGSNPNNGFLYAINDAQISVLVDALAEQGKVSVLSNPKIATLNNQRAVIKVGTEDVFFLPQIQPATTTAAQVTVFTVSSVTIGIVLDVLPQIDADGNIMMSINTSISEKSGERISPDNITSIPILDVRESNSVVLAKSGQTIVIGGLMKTTKEQNDNDVPYLSKIPLLGYLFRHKEEIERKTELVIMLTPEVMVGTGIDDRYRKEKQRMEQYNFSMN